MENQPVGQAQELLTPPSPQAPPLTTTTTTAYTHEAKATILASQFFPNPLVNPPPRGSYEVYKRLELDIKVTAAEIAAALRKTKKWKSPGFDNLPIGFLLACEEPVCTALAEIATASFSLGVFPSRFKQAKTVVLQKPGKPPGTYLTAKGYRPIALLSCAGKAVEKVLATRLTKLAEEKGLLPDEL